MYIAHDHGNPISMKMRRGPGWLAFGSVEDGQAWARQKGYKIMFNTLEEILRLNPRAFPKKFSVLYLPSSQAVDLLLRDPNKFPYAEFVVPLGHDIEPPKVPDPPSPPPEDGKQDKFKF